MNADGACNWVMNISQRLWLISFAVSIVNLGLRSVLRRAAADAVIARNGYEFGGARLRVEHAHRGAAGGGGGFGGGGGYGGGYGPPPYGGGYGGGYGGPPPRGGCEPLLLRGIAFRRSPAGNDSLCAPSAHGQNWCL